MVVVPILKILAVISAAATVSLGLAISKNGTESDLAAPWAQFCFDTNCTEGCGTWVSIENPGCLNQVDRRSIKFQGGPWGGWSLVVSPGLGCPCQIDCTLAIDKYKPKMCWDITEYAGNQSFRFIAEDCALDNC